MSTADRSHTLARCGLMVVVVLLANLCVAAAGKVPNETSAYEEVKVWGGYRIWLDGDINDIDAATGFSKLHQAVMIGYTDRVRHLINTGADVNLLARRGSEPVGASSSEGASALILAAQNGHVEIVRLLVTANAMLDVRSREDNTALFIAAARGHAKIVSLLLEAGAAIDRRGGNMGDGDDLDTPLTRSAYEGHAAVVRLLLAAGASVDARSEPGGGTALLLAIGQGSACYDETSARRKGHDQVIKLLLAAGASLNLRTHAGDTPLIAAVSMGCVDHVEAMIAAGADVNQPIASPGGHRPGIGDEGQTPLIAAAVMGELRIAQMLLDAGADRSRKDAEGHTAWSWAMGNCPSTDSLEECQARSAKKRRVAELLDPVATPEVQCPARYVIKLSDENALESFVEDVAGFIYQFDPGSGPSADPKMDAAQQAAFVLRQAARSSSRYFALDCLSEGAPGRPFERTWALVGEGHLAKFKDYRGPFIEWQAPPEEESEWAAHRSIPERGTSYAQTKSYHAQQPIHKAVVKGDLLEVKQLLRTGATVNDKDLDGDNAPIHLAVTSGHDQILDFLLRKGALLDMPTKEDVTALMIASRKGDRRMLTKLLAAGASVDARDDNGETALMAAVTSAAPAEIVKQLLRAGANINAMRFDNATALQLACSTNQTNLALALLAHGADHDIAISSGENPLILACMYGMHDVVVALLDAGANPNYQDDEGRSPLMIAVGSCHDLEIVKKLLKAGADPALQAPAPAGSPSAGRMTTAWHIAEYMKSSGDGRRCHTAAARLLAGGPYDVGSAGSRGASADSPLPTTVGAKAASAVGVFAAAILGGLVLLLFLKKDAVIAYLAGIPEDVDAPPRPAGRGRGGRGGGRGRAGRAGRAGRGGRGHGRGHGDDLALPAAPAEPTNEPAWWLEIREWSEQLDDAAREENPNFICHISQEIMRNPAMLALNGTSNHSYEYDGITEWFARGNDRDPITNEPMPPSQRSIIINGGLQRDIRAWCEGKVGEWTQVVAAPVPAAVPQRVGIHVFVDHSNVSIGARRTGRQLDVEQMIRSVEGDREAKKGFVAGSQMTDDHKAAWERCGYTVALDERAGPERFVDEALHAAMMDDVSRNFPERRVLVLLTGDGNANEGRTTFPSCLEHALTRDWDVEVFSWRSGASSVYAAMDEQYPAFRLRYLDEIVAAV